MRKYDPLKRYLEGIPITDCEKSLSFGEIERLLGFKLPASAYEYRAWWSNPSSQTDHPYAQSWIGAGWIVDSVDQLEKRVHFRRKSSQKIEINGLHTQNESNLPVINHERYLNRNNTSPLTDSKQFLLGLGFEDVGEWILENGKLNFKLTQYQNEQNIMYAFIVDDEVKYIGKSNQTLTGRMNGYKNPGPTQSTNIDKKARIVQTLQNGNSVHIFVHVQKEEVKFQNIPINLAAGLEDIIITRISPPWNTRK